MKFTYDGKYLIKTRVSKIMKQTVKLALYVYHLKAISMLPVSSSCRSDRLAPCCKWKAHTWDSIPVCDRTMNNGCLTVAMQSQSWLLAPLHLGKLYKQQLYNTHFETYGHAVYKVHVTTANFAAFCPYMSTRSKMYLLTTNSSYLHDRSGLLHSNALFPYRLTTSSKMMESRIFIH